MHIPAEVKVTRAASERLHDELATLTPEQWERPGACGVWSVADVAAHLVWAAEMYTDLIRSTLASDGTPPVRLEPVLPYAERAAKYADIAKEYRQRLGDRLLDAYASSARTLVELFESLGPADWPRLAYHPSGARTIRALLTLRLVELSIHGWEMLHRAGREAVLPDGSHEALVDWLPGRLRPAFAPREPLAEPLRYLFVVTAPLRRNIQMHLHGDRVEIDPPGEGYGSDVVITLSPDAYILLFTGRLDWREALAAGWLRATGRPDLVPDLTDWFPPG